MVVVKFFDLNPRALTNLLKIIRPAIITERLIFFSVQLQVRIIQARAIVIIFIIVDNVKSKLTIHQRSIDAP